MDDADNYFKSRFNTALNPDEMKGYAQWLAEQSTKLNRDVASDSIDYDMQGAWKSGVATSDNGHFPDTYKKPNHPTFSDQSIYHGVPDENGGSYFGGKWNDLGNGKYTYMPSPEMLSKTHDVKSMADYFKQHERDSQLVLPQGQ